MLIEDEKLFETQIDRLLQSSEFRDSGVLRRLLRFLADKAIDGEADQLKEYSVAVDGLGRPATYDPRQNSAVRIQAGRLRRKLSDYYRTEGKNDTVVIELPRGRFKLTCEQRFAPEAPALQPVNADVMGEGERVSRSEPVNGLDRHTTISKRKYLLMWFAIALASSAAFYFWMQTRGSNAKDTSPTTQWNPALEELWAPIIGSKRPLLLVIEDPLFIEFRGGTGTYYRDRTLNDWNTVSSSSTVAALQRALNNREIHPSRYYTSFGEVDASFLLSRVLSPKISNLSIIKNSLLSQRQLADNNILFVGVQTLSFEKQMQGLPLHPQLLPVAEGVRNLQPRPGEPAIFADQFPASTSEGGTAYAVVTQLPGPVGSNDIESFTSNRSEGYLGAVQSFTDPRFANTLTTQLKQTYGGHMPHYYQVLLKVDFKDNVPTGTTLVMSRELR